MIALWKVAVASLGGASAAAAYLAYQNTRRATVDAIKSGGTFEARLTGYWPETAKESERQMEGGLKDRKGHPLHTLEDFLAGKAEYVSVSGDYDIFPYGQRIQIDAWPNVVFRVVDTGSHFHGLKKLYRVTGAEPLDIDVHSSETHVPKLAKVTIAVGDNFEHGRAVATTKFKDQTVTGALPLRRERSGLLMLGGRRAA